MGVEPVTAILRVVVHFPGFSDHVPMPRSHVTRIGSRGSHCRFRRPFRPVPVIASDAATRRQRTSQVHIDFVCK